MDFGLAHSFSRSRRRVVSYSGTLLYLSPELLLQDEEENEEKKGKIKKIDFCVCFDDFFSFFFFLTLIFYLNSH